MSKKASKKATLPDRGCHNCKFWNEMTEAQDEERNGECRAMPPSALYDPEGGAFSMWPFTTQENWCGLWMPRLQ